jgi:hypothetical protein
MTNLTHNSFSMYLFQFSTCFEQSRAHHQENQLYQYNLWYISLCVAWPFRVQVGKFLSDLNTKQLYWYNWFSWWWARGCSKDAENWNKYIKKKNCASSWSFTKNHKEMHGQQYIRLYCGWYGKVNQSLYRPGHPLMVHVGWAFLNF